MKVSFHHKQAGGLEATFDENWNALSLLLEGDFSSTIEKHLEMKKKNTWMGNTSFIKFLGNGKYEIGSEIIMELDPVVIERKPLLLVLSKWQRYLKDKKDCEFKV